MKKILQKIETDTGIMLKLEMDVISNEYQLTIDDGRTVKVFKGSLDQIQKEAKKYFISSLKNIKDKVEISLLEEMLKRS